MRVLIVGDLDGQVGAASKIALSRGAKVITAEDITMAMSLLRSGKGADLGLIDVNQDIAGFIAALHGERFNLPVVACGIASDANSAVQAIKAGAKEYLPLPPDAELIAAVLEAVASENHNMIWSGAAMQQAVQLAEQIAASPASVLITGETGTGKEVMAKHIHLKSPRRSNTFISVNCAAIPENLLESELFGHEKGAFTGAVARRIGKFEEANGGTLLLDEIGEMDITLQAKLLRVIQEREIVRLGANKPVKVDIRILATTNRDLAEEVRAGRFREDLLFRLNVINIKLPPLRERPEDVAALGQHFTKKFAEVNGVPERPLSPDALTALKSYPWPGNVREMENTLHRAVLLAHGDFIEPTAIVLPDGTPILSAGNAGPQDERSIAAAAGQGLANAFAGANTGAVASLSGGEPGDIEIAGESSTMAAFVGRTVADMERDLIIDTLQHCLGNRTHAATILGISIRTLRNKLRQYTDEGVAVPQPGEGG